MGGFSGFSTLLWCSERAAVIRPVEQGLSLTRPTPSVARLAMAAELGDVPPHRLPAANLPFVFIGHTATLVVTAVPLKPAARVVTMDPSLRAPGTERLACVDAKPIQGMVAAAWRKSGLYEPACRKLGTAIGHVFATEHAEREHFGWREVRAKLRTEGAAFRHAQQIAISLDACLPSTEHEKRCGQRAGTLRSVFKDTTMILAGSDPVKTLALSE